MSQQTMADSDGQLKARHRMMWGLGDYATVARELIPTLGSELVRACAVEPGERVLDVASGSGNAAIPASLAGAQVVASDLTPELLAAGQRQAVEQGADLSWQEADAEALPYESAEFDVVMSCVGVMFAPHHQACADELVRVCRHGGRIGLISWTAEGFIGEMFSAMKPFVPAPPPGTQAPLLWGDPDHVRDLLGDRVGQFSAQRHMLTVDRFTAPAQFRDYFKSGYGPTVAAYRGLDGQPGRTAELDAALDSLAAAHLTHTGRTMQWEYLLVTAVRR
jgi:SAM-dependent methyltransferase